MSKPRYFLYARKSTEDDDKQVMSIEAQLFELREFASRENLEILAEFQESKSAKTPGREQFNIMMTRIESGEANGVLAWHPDRLARNSIDGGRVIYAVDTEKVSSLRFPTFWFEPTPQGLFMLQVAFGQSKYYSDNLKQNVERGMRQKLRRGEWLTKAPFGYINNPRTRNIEPDPVKSKLIVKAFEEYSSGSHTLVSLAQFLADHGLTTKAGTPLGKASVKRILTNRTYLGFTKHRGEYFPGSFAPILSSTLFEAVQKQLAKRARPQYKRTVHKFPFTGLFRCGECGSMITAQWATGRHGHKYRYYRCTKKQGYCSQGYLQEDALASQVKEQLQAVSLSSAAAEYLLNAIEGIELEDKSAEENRLGLLKDELLAIEKKLDALVDLHLDGDIERAVYLKKKDILMRQKLQLTAKKSIARDGRKNWVEPLRNWILDSKRAGFLSDSDDFDEIREFVRKFGTNPALCDKAISISFCPPSVFARSVALKAPSLSWCAASPRTSSELSEVEVSLCDPTGNRTPVSAVRGRRPSR